jgi:HPr Serine kinase C-terminal domain
MIQEIDAAEDSEAPSEGGRHEMEGPELSLQCTFYPYGFPLVVRTNSAEMMVLMEETWGVFEKHFDYEPLRTDIRVLETDATECPPAAVYRLMQPMLTATADKDNYLLSDLSAGRTYVTLSSTALRFKPYLRFFFLELTAGNHIGTRYATPVHGGCVSLHERGVLLCGESGAGKSTLSYACARSGWRYVTDDCSFLLNSEERNIVTGNCHKVRFRPTAAELFPEIAEIDLTPRAGGKPSIELPTGPMQNIVRSQMEEVNFIVFLNRQSGNEPGLFPHGKSAARQFMRRELYGTKETLAAQHQAIERLLKVDVLELRYADLNWAIDQLRTLVEEVR